MEGTMATGQEHVWNTQEECTGRLVDKQGEHGLPGRGDLNVLKWGKGRGRQRLAHSVGTEEVVRNPILERCEQSADELEMMVMDDGTVSSG